MLVYLYPSPLYTCDAFSFSLSLKGGLYLHPYTDLCFAPFSLLFHNLFPFPLLPLLLIILIILHILLPFVFVMVISLYNFLILLITLLNLLTMLLCPPFLINVPIFCLVLLIPAVVSLSHTLLFG